LLVQYHLLEHHLHHLLKCVDFSWNYFCNDKLIGFLNYINISINIIMHTILSFTKLKLVLVLNHFRLILAPIPI
jgi:hypothetical protein